MTTPTMLKLAPIQYSYNARAHHSPFISIERQLVPFRYVATKVAAQLGDAGRDRVAVDRSFSASRSTQMFT